MRFPLASSPGLQRLSTSPLRLAAILLLLGFLSLSLGQSTQPSLDAWQQYVSSIADALVGDGKTDALSQLIPDTAEISQFDSRETETRFRLAHRVNHMTVLWQHAYPTTPATMVTDLSTELPVDGSLPPELRKKLIPKDAAAMAKADATAQKWISRVIGETPNGMSVVIFWDRPAADASPAATVREPVFVLMKGGQSVGPPTVAQIRYGDMSQALN